MALLPFFDDGLPLEELADQELLEALMRGSYDEPATRFVVEAIRGRVSHPVI